MKRNKLHYVLVLSCLFIGVFVRGWNFIENPGGMNQDEAGSLYEAFALLTEGTDRWGLPWPSYFPAWGSGQNALLTYLSIPFVAIFGPSVFVVRGIVLASALATLPLVYVSARMAFGRATALVALFFTVICPWHIMMSRWGLESNLLPFFWIGTMVCLQLGFRNPDVGVWRILAPILAVLSLYAYSVAVFSMTAFIVLALLFFRKDFRINFRFWVIGSILALIIGLPLLHFLLKNHVFKSNLVVDQFVPWTAPLLPITRLAQLSGGFLDVIKFNFIEFFGNAFADGLVWNTLPGHSPLAFLLVLLVPFGIFGLLIDVKRGKFNGIVVFAAFMGALAPFFAFFVNVNRANGLYLPLILLAARGAILLSLEALSIVSIQGRWKKWQGVFAWSSLLALMGFCLHPSLLFSRDYFKNYSDIMSSVFRVGVTEAVLNARAFAHQNQLSIFFDDSIFMNYIYVLVAEKMPPSEFLALSNADRSRFVVSRVGPWRFSRNELFQMPNHQFVFLNLHTTQPPCASPRNLERVGSFFWGVCP